MYLFVFYREYSMQRRSHPSFIFQGRSTGSSLPWPFFTATTVKHDPLSPALLLLHYRTAFLPRSTAHPFSARLITRVPKLAPSSPPAQPVPCPLSPGHTPLPGPSRPASRTALDGVPCMATDGPRCLRLHVGLMSSAFLKH